MAQRHPVGLRPDTRPGPHRSHTAAKHQCVAGPGIVQRLQAEPVSQQHQRTRAGVACRQSKHSVQPRGTAGAPFPPGSQHGFRVATRAKPVTSRLQFPPQFQIVVQLTVVGQNMRPVFGNERQTARRRIANRQSRLDEGQWPPLVHATTVRAPQVQRLLHLPQSRFGRRQ